jgi:hypothetical protein
LNSTNGQGGQALIIWGSKGKTKTIGSGTFYCPHCQARRNYEHIKVGKYFTLYFIPLFETKNLGEYIECKSCMMTFKKEVLELGPQIAERIETENQIRQLINKISSGLNAGTPVQFILEGLVQSGVEKDIASRLLYEATGGKLKKCSRCGGIFKDELFYCSTCGSNLEKYDIQ